MSYLSTKLTNRFTDFLYDVFNRLLPAESKSRNVLAYLYYHYRNPLYDLSSSNIIKSLHMLPNNILLCELRNGSKFIIPPDMVISRMIKYGKTNKLREIKHYPYFGGFFKILNDIWVLSIYERFYKLRKGGIVIDAGANIGCSR